MQNAHFWIRNITEEDYATILKLAVAKTGRASLSALARALVLEHLSSYATKKQAVIPKRKRLEIRLDDDTFSALHDVAQQSHMTTSQLASMLLEQYIDKSPKLTTAEIQALYQSNQQLLMIGRNLNQIAKALNSGLPAQLSTDAIQTLESTIKKHMETVGELISANYDRMPS